jgi:hypothetical protein
MKNKNLLSYIFGMLTVLLFVPLIEDLSAILSSWFQVLVLKPTKLVLKGNKEIAELQANSQEIDTHCIGFKIPTEEDFDDEDFE